MAVPIPIFDSAKRNIPKTSLKADIIDRKLLLIPFVGRVEIIVVGAFEGCTVVVGGFVVASESMLKNT